MADIETGKELKFENLISLRKKIIQEEFQLEIEEIGRFLESKNIKKNGPLITTILNIEVINGIQVFDTEILVPIEKKIDFSEKYSFKKIFYLTNAVYLRHTGSLIDLGNTYDRILSYIDENKLRQITSAYNLYIENGDLENIIIDVYIGINPSIL